jgi:hypothetical protein
VSKKEGAKQSKLSNNEKNIIINSLYSITASCGYACIDTSKLVVITSIESAGANKCDYYGYGNSSMTYNIWTSDCSRIETYVVKFQIGDTITFTKVKAATILL